MSFEAGCEMYKAQWCGIFAEEISLQAKKGNRLNIAMRRAITH